MRQNVNRSKRADVLRCPGQYEGLQRIMNDMNVDFIEIMRADRIVPVVVIEDAEQALPLAEALQASGLNTIEITLRTSAALDAVKRIAESTHLCVGAGTVLTVEQAQASHDAGAHFLVSPGSNPDVIQYCIHQGISILPGVCSPTDIELARATGIKTLKFFPAEAAGGVEFLKAISAPYQDVQFVPTGGINDATLGSYLKLPSVVACGASWIVDKSMLAKDDWDEVSRRCRALVKIASD